MYMYNYLRTELPKLGICTHTYTYMYIYIYIYIMYTILYYTRLDYTIL